MQSSHADLHAGLYAGSEYTQLAEYAQARVDGCMNTAYRVCGGLRGGCMYTAYRVCGNSTCKAMAKDRVVLLEGSL
jgi:hypothetical protein